MDLRKFLTRVEGAEDAALITRLERKLLDVARSAGMTTDEAVYRESYTRYFETLDEYDELLNTQAFLCAGKAPSAADEYFAVLLALHDLVFHRLYKLNRSRLQDFVNLGHFARAQFQQAAFRGKVDFGALKEHFFYESALINPKQRLPISEFDFDRPHDRELRFGEANEQSDIEERPQDKREAGEWLRKICGHRQIISSDADAMYPPAAGRYHLYVANNCPWCHRTALTRELKGLNEVVTMDVLYYRRDPQRGWQFAPDEDGCTEDSLFGSQYIREVYDRAKSTETSVPILWDKLTNTIVSNESAEIIRMFDQGFESFSNGSIQLYPTTLRTQIDRINTFVYHAINNGAYKAGFADAQTAYEAAYHKFFDALDILEEMLRGRNYLLGDAMTEADVRLFPTLYRFDAVYFTRFDLNKRMLRDSPPLQSWLDRMLKNPAIARASNLGHCRQGYFGRNGNNIVPLGPE